MTKMFFALMMAVSTTTLAKTTKLIRSNSAVLNLCPYKMGKPVLIGCADSISLSPNGDAMKFGMAPEADVSVEKALNNLIGTYRFHSLTVSPKLKVVGRISRMKGFFPNPMVEFTVFEIVDIKNIHSIPLPK